MSRPAGKVRSNARKQKHAPLLHQIDPTIPLNMRKGKTTRQEIADDEDLAEDQEVKGRLSKKVLENIKKQQQEINLEDTTATTTEDQEAAEATRNRLQNLSAKALLTGEYEDDDEEEGNVGGYRVNDDDDAFDVQDHDDEDNTFLQNDEQGLGLGDEDRALLDAFLPQSFQTKSSLTSTILDDAETRQNALGLGLKLQTKEGGVELKPAVSKEVIIVYKKIGQFLAKYRSGKLPKPFKIIPTLRNWEEVLYYTNPADWTPQATNAAVRLFTTVLKPKHAQRFFNLVLAPKVSHQIAKDGKLGYHLYDALRRAIYKPTAFFKGLVLPIAAGQEVATFPGQNPAPLSKEVIVYASILSRIHIPQMHAAVTLLQLTKILPFNPYNVLLMKVLLNKNFSLPIPVLEGIFAYFYETAHDEANLINVVNPKTQKSVRSLPLLWHKTLLIFVQKYKQSFTPDMIAMARAIIKKLPHWAISDEIRKELAVAGKVTAVTQQVIDTTMFD